MQSPRLTLLPPLTLRPTPGMRMDTTDTIPPTTGGDTTAGAILTDMATGAERRGRPRLSRLPLPIPTLRPAPGTRMDTTDTIPPTTGDTTAGAILTGMAMATMAERRGRPSQRLSLLPLPMPTLRLTPGTRMDTTIPPTTGDTTAAGATLTGMATGAERRGRPRLSLLPPLMLTLRLTPTTATTATIPTTGDTTVTATGPADTG